MSFNVCKAQQGPVLFITNIFQSQNVTPWLINYWQDGKRDSRQTNIKFFNIMRPGAFILKEHASFPYKCVKGARRSDTYVTNKPLYIMWETEN